MTYYSPKYDYGQYKQGQPQGGYQQQPPKKKKPSAAQQAGNVAAGYAANYVADAAVDYAAQQVGAYFAQQAAAQAAAQGAGGGAASAAGGGASSLGGYAATAAPYAAAAAGAAMMAHAGHNMLNAFNENRTNKEENRWKELANMGMVVDPSLMVQSDKDKFDNPAFTASRDERALQPQNITNAAIWAQRYGPAWLGLDPAIQQEVANLALNQGAVREHHGTFDVKFTPEIEALVKEKLPGVDTSSWYSNSLSAQLSQNPFAITGALAKTPLRRPSYQDRFNNNPIDYAAAGEAFWDKHMKEHGRSDVQPVEGKTPATMSFPTSSWPGMRKEDTQPSQLPQPQLPATSLSGINLPAQTMSAGQTPQLTMDTLSAITQSIYDPIKQFNAGLVAQAKEQQQKNRQAQQQALSAELISPYINSAMQRGQGGYLSDVTGFGKSETASPFFSVAQKYGMFGGGRR